MNALPRLIAASLALTCACAALAQQHDTSQRAPVRPPPGLNDPGVDVQSAPKARPPAQQAASEPAPAASARGLPPLPSLPEDGTRDANGHPPPTVSVHQRDGNTIEEYREGGQLVMVRITRKHGIPYSYYVDPSGKLRGPPGAPPVKPVYYTIFEWGKPPAPADQQ